MVLFEKEATFREQIVLLIKGEQNEPWYMKVTPKGTVPALEIPGTVLTDSEDIVNYLDRELDTGIKLIPNPESKIGQTVETWRQKFNALNLAVISYGIMFHPELSQTGIQFPPAMRDKATQSMQNARESLQEKADGNPEHRDNFLTKISIQNERLAKMKNKEVVIQHLNDLDTLFDLIESRLADTRKEQGVDDSWLVGSRFTMADINLVILLDRLTLLGMKERYFPSPKRPLTHDFYVRMGKRRSVQQLRQKFKDVMKAMVGRMMVKSVPAVVGVVGVVAGLFYWRSRTR